MILKILLAFFTLAFPYYALAFENSTAVKVTPLLKTTTSWDGKTLEYPSGEAQITGLSIEIAPGTELGWHEHPVPSFGVIMQGTLDVRLQNGQVRRLQAGDAIAEVVNTLHNSKNVGKDSVKIIVFYAGTTDSALTIPHPEIGN